MRRSEARRDDAPGASCATLSLPPTHPDVEKERWWTPWLHSWEVSVGEVGKLAGLGNLPFARLPDDSAYRILLVQHRHVEEPCRSAHDWDHHKMILRGLEHAETLFVDHRRASWANIPRAGVTHAAPRTPRRPPRRQYQYLLV